MWQFFNYFVAREWSEAYPLAGLAKCQDVCNEMCFAYPNTTP
ncbi:hypothetical protein ThidrDRAFT_3490 [Thiorhodococcus drewsii AZ1]|uniref:Uncharacterized protein n=1 Tax=Thiorhodococcus drewsii AZ1 TaxID=765913 RepID=G2E5C7_9GAMM|nr:hypothetical protein ThidrDRAFT_3490 [Thiorhodococcus drewsii AZ1]